LVLEHVRVLSYYVVECYVRHLRCLTNSIDSAHNDLIEVSIDHELWFSGETGLHDDPDLLLDVFLDANQFAQLINPLCHQVQHSLEKHIVRLHDHLVLCLFSHHLHITTTQVLLQLLLNDIYHGRAALPGNFADYFDLDFPEVVGQDARHLGVEL
jgi:hypothetical protein